MGASGAAAFEPFIADSPRASKSSTCFVSSIQVLYTSLKYEYQGASTIHTSRRHAPTQRRPASIENRQQRCLAVEGHITPGIK